MSDNRSAIEKQAASRLRVLNSRIAKLQDEKALIERILADNARRFSQRPINLRKNSLSKLAIENEIRAYLQIQTSPVKAQTLYGILLSKDAKLKGATFRSHIKRLTEAGVIEREGSRGHYQLVTLAAVEDVPREREDAEPRRRSVSYGYIDAAKMGRPKII